MSVTILSGQSLFLAFANASQYNSVEQADSVTGSAMTVDHDAVRRHIQRALAAHEQVPDALRRLTKAFRLLQAERRDPVLAADESLAAAEGYLFARQAVAGNAVSLVQMLTMAADEGVHGDTRQRVSRYVQADAKRSTASGASQDRINWAVAGARKGEADRLTHLPDSVPPPFKPAFVRSGWVAAGSDGCAARDASA